MAFDLSPTSFPSDLTFPIAVPYEPGFFEDGRRRKAMAISEEGSEAKTGLGSTAQATAMKRRIRRGNIIVFRIRFDQDTAKASERFDAHDWRRFASVPQSWRSFQGTADREDSNMKYSIERSMRFDFI